VCFCERTGLLKEKYGTVAWAIEAESSVHRCTEEDIPPAAESRVNRCTKVNIVPRAPTDQSAYRSEVAGIFGIATMIRPSTLGVMVSPLCKDVDYVSTLCLDNSNEGDASTMPGKMDTTSRRHSGIKTTTPMPSLTAGQLSILKYTTGPKYNVPTLLN
jgi:hypothetical protein